MLMQRRRSHAIYTILFITAVLTLSYGAGKKPEKSAPSAQVANQAINSAPVFSTVDPADENLAEYRYQQALLHLGRDERAKAVALLKIYAASGRNPRQVEQARALIAQHDHK
jgi:hypothetical protein